MFAPNAESISVQLSIDYGTNASLSVWSHALLNTSLFPLDPKPAWSDRVNTTLNTAKTSTKTWLFEQYPDVAAALPQSLIDYGNNFVSGADELIRLFAAPLTDSTRAAAAAVIQSLREEAITQQFRVRGLQNKVIAFSELARKTATTLSKDREAVMASLKGASADVHKLQERINDLYRELGISATEAKHEMEGAAMKGLSIAGTLMVFSLTAAMSTASFPVISLAIGVIALTIGAIEEKAKSDSVVAKIREITSLQVKLTGEQMQAAALQAMVSALEMLDDITRDAQTNMVGSVHYWDDITSNLELATEILAQKNFDPRVLTPFTKIASAKSAWEKIITSAENVQASTLKMQAPIHIGGTAA